MALIKKEIDQINEQHFLGINYTSEELALRWLLDGIFQEFDITADGALVDGYVEIFKNDVITLESKAEIQTMLLATADQN